MKPKSELTGTIAQIVDPQSPVGMDAVYVHALILDKLTQIEARLNHIESRLDPSSDSSVHASGEVGT